MYVRRSGLHLNLRCMLADAWQTIALAPELNLCTLLGTHQHAAVV